MSFHLSASAEQSTLPPAQNPLVSYLETSIVDLVGQVDGLFSRYKAAGTKYHAMPFAVRASTHLEGNMADMLEEVFSITTDSRPPVCVAETFSDMIWCIAQAQRSLENEYPDVGAADKFVLNASDVAKKLKYCVHATEFAVADVVALKNSLNEQGVLANPDPWAEDRLTCFREWAEALLEWTKDMSEMTHEMAKESNGLDAIFGFGG
jgi:hypothetical protein